MCTHINPRDYFKEKLLSIQNPATYVGGEFGTVIKKDEDVDTFVRLIIFICSYLSLASIFVLK